MLEINDIQSAYNNLYKVLRNYFWPIDTVEKLAELEIECYKSFPDISALRSLFEKLFLDIRECAAENEELSKQCDKFREIVQSSDSIYNKLTKVNEVI